MNEYDTKEQCKLEMDTALQLLEVAKMNFQYEFYNSAVNRMYYACFHAVNALLLGLGHKNYKSHDGAKQLFGLHCIKTGMIDKKWGRFFSTLMQYRNDSDYDVFVIYQKEDAEPLLSESIAFIKELKTAIETYGQL